MKLKDYLVEELIPYGRYRHSNEVIGKIHEYSGVSPNGLWVQVRILDSIMQRKTYLMRVIVGGTTYLARPEGFHEDLEQMVLSAHYKRTAGIGDMEV